MPSSRLLLLAAAPVLAAATLLLAPDLRERPTAPPATVAPAPERPVAPPPAAGQGVAPGPGMPRLIVRPLPDPEQVAARMAAQDAAAADPAWIAERDDLRGLYRAGAFEALADAAEDAALRFPDAVEAHALAGLAHARLGHVEAARPHLHVVAERAGDDPDYRMAVLTLRMIDPQDRQALEGPARSE